MIVSESGTSQNNQAHLSTTTMTSQELTPSELKAILDFTVSLARTAGQLILEGSAAIQASSSDSDISEKKNSVDLVTEYDVKVEELVKKEIKTKYPEFKL